MSLSGDRGYRSASIVNVSSMPPPPLPDRHGGYDPLMPPPPLPSTTLTNKSHMNATFTGYRSAGKRKRSEVEIEGGGGYEDTEFSRATTNQIPDLDTAWSGNAGTSFTRGPVGSLIMRGGGSYLPSVVERGFARMGNIGESSSEVAMTESGRNREGEKDDETHTRKKMRKE
jgi:hypothetical protein